MKVDCIEVGPFAVNCYVVAGSGNEALVIDPGADPGRIVAAVKKQRLSVAAFLLTHGHVDHISGLAGVCESFPARILMPADDGRWAFSETNQWPPFYPPPRRPAGDIVLLGGEEERSEGGMAFRVLRTPGHTPGGVCYYFPAEHAVFTGDTLFAGSVGRVDLPGGDSRALTSSVARLAELPVETVVYPGHGPASTIEVELETNFYLQGIR
jgi:glyoxylase-like metal-dependent hydrolase (beta-lactamase superfamily II)